MQTINIKQKLQSGNHGSDSETKKNDDKAPGWMPKQSKQKFVAPVINPVKKSPSLKEIIKDTSIQDQKNEEIQPKENNTLKPDTNLPEIENEVKNEITDTSFANDSQDDNSSSESQKEIENQSNRVNIGNSQIIPKAPEEISSESKVELVQEEIPDNINQGETQPDQESSLDFMSHWNNMLDVVFDKVPTVYFSLKNNLPDILDNDILITVKNELQKGEIEMRQRDILSYLRNNFNNEIEKIKIIIDADLESKVVILDNREKIRILKEQNTDIVNFIEILKLKTNE